MALTEGMQLRLPAGVTSNTYNAATFKPYNPGKEMGSINNDGTFNLDYSASIANRTITSNTNRTVAHHY